LAVENCGSCRFAELAEKPSDWGRVVTCRRYPPALISVEGQPRMMWPLLLESGWCGEFHAGEPHLGRGDNWQVAKDTLKRVEVN
jgi:hypothetical protein